MNTARTLTPDVVAAWWSAADAADAMRLTDAELRAQVADLIADADDEDDDEAVDIAAAVIESRRYLATLIA